MAPNAVILLILSQLFLLSHASIDPSAVSRWDPQQPQEEKRDAMIQEQQQDGPSPKETSSVVAFDPRPAHLPADADLSRMIAHSLRFPTGRHGAHHLRHASLRPTVELSYGNDMVGVPIKEKKINKMEEKKKKKKHHDDDDDDDEDDWTEHKMRKKMMMKKRLKKMMLKKFKRDRERESRGGLTNWISSILNRF